MTGMTISDLVLQLQQIQFEHGDLEVLIGSSHFSEDPDPRVSDRGAPRPVVLL